MVSLPPPRVTELFYGGAWHNISGSMRESSPVTITRGVSAEGNQPDPMAATATLDNRSGDYSPRNPHSALYGLIGRNTPWRVSVEAGGPWLASTGANGARISTPDSAALTVSGDFDLRMDVALDDLHRGHVLALRYRVTGESRSWALEMDTSGRLIFLWSPDGTFAARRDVSSTVPVPIHQGQRVTLRVTLDVNNGAGGHTVRFYYGMAVDSTAWTQIGDAITGTGATGVFDGTAPLEVGDGTEFSTLPSGGALSALRGAIYGLRLYDGIDGTLKASLTCAPSQVGDTTVTSGGLVWTLAGSMTLSNRHIRMVGEVPAWPPARDLSGADRTVAIAPAGIMRRLGVGAKPLASALRRFILGHPAAIDCWPLTDGPQSQRANSLMGGTPLMPLGDSANRIQWGKGDLGDWLEPVAAITRETYGTFKADIARKPSAEDGWAVDFLRSGDGVDIGMTIIDYGVGTIADPRVHWTLVNQDVPGDDTLFLFADVYADDNVDAYTLAMIAGSGLQDGRPHHLRLAAEHSGGSTLWSLFLDGDVIDSGIEAFYARPPKSIAYDWNPTFSTADTTDLAVGYLTYWDADAPGASEVVDAYRGFIGEAAGTRVLRVAAERGVPASMYGEETDSTLLGVQRPERFLDTLTTIARTDLGYVLERRDALELVYRGRHTLYNQPPTVTLDWENGVISAPFRPIDDDKLTRNDVTVKRDGGGETTAVLESGPMSVLDPPDGVGRYDVAHTLSLATDDQTGDHAYWRMHLGTYDGLRYTKVTVNLGNPRAYALVDQLYRADVGDLLRLENLPADYGGGSTDLLIRGYTEEISATGWTITYTCDPGSPWTVGVVEDPLLGRADTDGTELADAVTSSQTMLPIAVTAGPDWITSAVHPTEFPFDVAVGGEHATVTAITGVAEDVFARTVASGWGTANSGQTWALDGGTAADYAVASGTGRLLLPAGAFRAAVVTVTTPDVDLAVDYMLPTPPAGDSAYVYPVVRYTDGANLYFARVQIGSTGVMSLTLRKRVGGTETLLASYATGMTFGAGTWYRVRLAVTGSDLSAKTWLRSAAEPASWQASATDTDLTAPASVGVRGFIGGSSTNAMPFTLQFDNFHVNPQAMTVIRSVNGITKSHAAGTDIRLAQPTIVAL